jgi:choline kinase
MKAVILAAGRGDRLRPFTDTVPKPLIEIGGQTLLHRALDQLQANGLKDVCIVTGYLGGLIRQHTGTHYKGMRVVYADNPDYGRTGSMYSLSKLRGLLDDDIVLIESDLLFEPKALKILLEAPQNNAILTAALLNHGDDVYVCTNGNAQIICLGKILPNIYGQKVTGCLVGISKFSAHFLQQVFAFAQQDYDRGLLNYHYEDCVFRVSSGHTPVYAVHAPELIWTEIDTPQDLHNAVAAVYPRLQDVAL